MEKDGYKAIQLGFEEAKEKNTTKALQGIFKKAGTTPKKHLAEFKFDEEYNLGDTITVVARDSVILNRATNEATISLPMSYDGAADTLVFHFTPSGSKASISDTLIVSKTNEPHVISLECGTSIFHTITNATCTSRTPNSTFRYAISRVAVSQPNVNFDGQENLKIYLAVHQ